jgi:hypothetical protein
LPLGATAGLRRRPVPGDTPTKISRRYGKSSVAVAKANNIRTRPKLNMGGHTVIPPRKVANAQERGRSVVEQRPATLAGRKPPVTGPPENPDTVGSVVDATPNFHSKVRSLPASVPDLMASGMMA